MRLPGVGEQLRRPCIEHKLGMPEKFATFLHSDVKNLNRSMPAGGTPERQGVRTRERAAPPICSRHVAVDLSARAHRREQ